MKARHILAAESDGNMRGALFTALTRLGHAVETAGDGEEALARFGAERFDLALIDLRLGKIPGLRVLREIKKLRPDFPVIILSQGGRVEDAVAAMREGAQDFLMKPFPAGVIEGTVAKIFEKDGEKAKEARENGKDAVSKSGETRPVVFKSEIMEKLLNLAKHLADSSATVLLQGESGTGKEVMARFIHNNSKRKDGPFVAVNCAGLPEALLESELFGHEKGAFTGALNRKPGKFDLADGGTLLLDEISEMDVSLQAKLLRALQEGEIDPVGGKGPHKIDARVIATTNRQLKSWVDEGKFRADLYYRLNVMPIYIPGLKDRKDDILPLTRFFMENYSRQNGKTVTDIEPEALEFLMSHDWPGNIRELENTIARAVLMTRGTSIKAEDIFMDETGFMLALERNSRVPETTEPEERPSESPHSAPGEIPRADETPLSEAGFAFQSGSGETSPEEDDVPGESFRAAVAGFPAGSEGMPVMTIEEMERRLIGRALNETSGNRTHAAKLLGISVRTLRNKLNEYRAGQIPEPEAASAMIG